MDAQVVNSRTVARLPKAVRQTMNAVKADLKQVYGDQLVKLVLYGSYARGDFHEESDIDLLAVLKKLETNAWQEKKRLSDVAYPYFEKDYTQVPLTPVTLMKFEKGDSFLLRSMKDLIKQKLDKAQDSHNAARLLYDQHFIEASINRSYYAMFDTIRTLLFMKEVFAKIHKEGPREISRKA